MAAGPVDGLPDDGGVEEAGSGNVFGTASEGGCGCEKEKERNEKGGLEAPRDAARAGGAKQSGARER
jgi:hypothetical protein